LGFILRITPHAQFVASLRYLRRLIHCLTFSNVEQTLSEKNSLIQWQQRLESGDDYYLPLSKGVAAIG